jgi:rSAM/selenodomain-associated transferase 2
MPAPISIIIPTLNSEYELPETLTSLFEGIEKNLIRELIISDGGSLDKTKIIASEVGAVFLEGTGGRGAQIKRGIEKSCGDWILVLHSDTSLSSNWTEQIFPNIDKKFAYYFKLKFKSNSIFAYFLETWANLRSKIFDLPYGDQGLLIHRDLVTSIGGFPSLPIMEDVALAGKLKRKLKSLNIIAQTSAKKYQKKGWLRQSLINFSILIRFKLGQETALLYRFYYKN